MISNDKRACGHRSTCLQSRRSVEVRQPFKLPRYGVPGSRPDWERDVGGHAGVGRRAISDYLSGTPAAVLRCWGRGAVLGQERKRTVWSWIRGTRMRLSPGLFEGPRRLPDSGFPDSGTSPISPSGLAAGKPLQCLRVVSFQPLMRWASTWCSAAQIVPTPYRSWFGWISLSHRHGRFRSIICAALH